MIDQGKGVRGKRCRILRVVVDQSEADRILALAQATGHTVSGYLRRIGLGEPPKPVLDQHLILDLVRINGDQGRLGGLLKLWLAERPGQGAGVGEVRRLLRDIEAAQLALKRAINRL